MNLEVRFEGNKKINAYYKGHVIKTDQSVKAGGDDSASAPFDLFLASIGTCAGIYVKSFCDRRDIPTDGIRIIQSAEYDEKTGLPVNITWIFSCLPVFRKNTSQPLSMPLICAK